MCLKKLGIVLLAVAALSAVTAGSASASATTTAAQWYTGASPGATTLSGWTTLDASIVPETKFVLESKVGSGATPIKLTATGFECSIVCEITNKEVTNKAGKVAFGTGKIKFTGVTADEPSTCSVTSESSDYRQILSKTLNLHADFMNGSTAVQQFVPAAGAGTSLAAFRLVNGTGTCPVAGLYSITGTLFVDASNPTGVQTTSQRMNISPAIETADGGGLFIGSQPAYLTGSADFYLFSGAAFGVH